MSQSGNNLKLFIGMGASAGNSASTISITDTGGIIKVVDSDASPALISTFGLAVGSDIIVTGFAGLDADAPGGFRATVTAVTESEATLWAEGIIALDEAGEPIEPFTPAAQSAGEAITIKTEVFKEIKGQADGSYDLAGSTADNTDKDSGGFEKQLTVSRALSGSISGNRKFPDPALERAETISLSDVTDPNADQMAYMRGRLNKAGDYYAFLGNVSSLGTSGAAKDSTKYSLSFASYGVVVKRTYA